jgi:hypothetical protein
MRQKREGVMDITDRLRNLLRDGEADALNDLRRHRTEKGLLDLSKLIIPSGTELAYADLSRADLSETRFWGVNLMSANLKFSNLQRAIFFDSKVWGADFSNTDLRSAVFWQTKSVCNAQFWGANFTETILGGLDEKELLHISRQGVNVHLTNVNPTVGIHRFFGESAEEGRLGHLHVVQ